MWCTSCYILLSLNMVLLSDTCHSSHACKYCWWNIFLSSLVLHDYNKFILHTCFTKQPTGLTPILNSRTLSLFYTVRHQNNLSDEQEGKWRAPCSSAPPPCDDTPQICSLCDSGYTCDSPVHVRSPEIFLTCHSPPNPSSTHTYTPSSTQGKGGGFSLDWGARRCPCALIFTSPTMTLCNWWHKWPPAACLLCCLALIPSSSMSSHLQHYLLCCNNFTLASVCMQHGT